MSDSIHLRDRLPSEDALRLVGVLVLLVVGVVLRTAGLGGVTT
jgi:hypothetical protein